MTIQERISDSYNKQQFMQTIGAELVTVEEGEVIIACTFDKSLTQQHGFIHAGVIATIADVACGYAALSMMIENKEVLTVEFKTSLMRPAKSKKIIAIAKVIKSGRTLTFCEARVTDETGDIEIAKMMATMISVDR